VLVKLIWRNTFLAIVVVGVFASVAAAAQKFVHEVKLSKEELNKLDTFEGHMLAKADQAFNKELYRQARAEYDSFIAEFPRSKLIPYALLRKGRCAQFDDKRFKAIADYQEILDYFPNDVKYAAAGLYFIGDCHMKNGDIEKAMKAWARMADDKEYRSEPLAAFAINQLADHLMRQEKEPEAVKYYEQVAVTFRTDNPEASAHARGPVVRFYIRSSPNEPRFREFYTNVKGLDQHPRPLTGDLTKNEYYWSCLRAYIRHYGTFEDSQADQGKRYYAYWSGQMQGKFPDDDEFQIELANFRYLADGDRGRWYQFLDGQYSRRQQRGDWQRTLRWMQLYASNPAKVQQYFNKIDLARVDNDAVVAIMRVLWQLPDTRALAKNLLGRLKFDQMSNSLLGSLALEFYEDNQVVTSRLLSKIDFAKMSGREIGSLALSFWGKDSQLGRHLLAKVRFGEMQDREIAALARSFWQTDGGVVRDVCLRTKDKDYGKSELLSYYHSRWGWNPRAGLPLADDLVKIDKYATDAWCIAAFQNCQNEPTNLWRIADCQVKLGKLETAVAQVREIENFFLSEAPKAALHIAYLYRNAGEKKKYIQGLRHVLKKYPESGQSRQAHLELEEQGIKMGGGIDAN